MKARILVVTHGDLGAEFISTAGDITGRASDISFFAVRRNLSADEIKSSFRELLGNLLRVSPVLILTDMMGGTPTNISLPHIENENVEIVTGISLPMLIRTLQKQATVKDLKELAALAAASGVQGVVNCSAALDD